MEGLDFKVDGLNKGVDPVDLPESDADGRATAGTGERAEVTLNRDADKDAPALGVGVGWLRLLSRATGIRFDGGDAPVTTLLLAGLRAVAAAVAGNSAPALLCADAANAAGAERCAAGEGAGVTRAVPCWREGDFGPLGHRPHRSDHRPV